MKRITSLLASLALAAPLALGASVAAAQPWSPRPAASARGYRFAPAPRPMRVAKTATIQSLLFAGRRLRGVVLSDGSTALLSRADAMLARRLRVGQRVRVSGMSLPGSAQITQASIRVLRPAPLAAPAPATFSARGYVRALRFGSAGRPSTLVLTNGRAIAIPANLGRALAQRGVQRGEAVSITGHRTGPASSAGFVADSITFSRGATFSANPAPSPWARY